MSQRGQILEITSPNNPKIKDIRSLFLRKYRRETGWFLAEGLRSVIEGIDNGAELVRLVYAAGLERPDLERAKQACLDNDGLCLEVNKDVLEKLAQKDNPQQVIGVFRQNFAKLADVKADKSKLWVVLEEVRDPGNLGTIIRTVDGVGADGVIMVGNCCDPYSVEAVRATMGSVFSVPFVHVQQDEFLQWAKSWNGKIVGTALNDRSVDYRDVNYAETLPVLLCMGNEQAGLSDTMMDHCTHIVKLPMNGRADSLNLAVATGIMLYTILER